jgi:hypothetical protein
MRKRITTTLAGAVLAAAAVSTLTAGTASAAEGDNPYPGCGDAIAKYYASLPGAAGGVGAPSAALAYKDMIAKCPDYPIDATVD